MTRLSNVLIAVFILVVSTPAEAGDSRAQSAVDPSIVEWSAARYLNAPPMEPLLVRSVSRDPSATDSATPLEGGSLGAPGRPPTSRSLPDFDLYIHEPRVRPAYLSSRRRRQPGRRAAVVPDDGPLENRGTSELEFSSSRIVPRDARMAYPYSAVGKLFFDKPGGGSAYCSASVVQRRVLLTAGHCIYTPGDGWHTNFSYVPAYFQGNAPYGTWRAETIFVTGEWFGGGNRYPNVADFGALVMRDNAQGERLGEVTGWLGWKTNRLTPNHLHILGYPSNLDAGMEMHQVASGGFDCCFGGTAIYGTDMREGSSGGPWVQNFGMRAKKQRIGKNRQQNRIVGVYSWLFEDDKKILVAGSSIPKAPFSNLISMACGDGPGNCSE